MLPSFCATQGTSKNKKEPPAKAKGTQTKKKGGRGNGGNTKNVIMEKMAESLSVGITEVTEAELLTATGYAKHDCKGFRIPRNELIKEDGFLIKTSSGTGTNKSFIYSLTDQGRQHLQEQGKIAPEPKSLKERQDQFLNNIKNTCKAPSEKIEAIWNLLVDGEVHSTKEALGAAGYKGVDSGGYKHIMKAFKAMKLLDTGAGRGNLKFSDKVLVF